MKRGLKIAGLAAAGLALTGFLVMTSGIIPVKASDGHWPFTSWLLRFSMHRSMATHGLGSKPPPLDDPGMILKGATHFDFSCRGCHGAPGIAPARVTQTMLPRPADLVPCVPELSSKQLFQIAKHGVKFTGMPAFPSQERDDEVWAVVAFLRQLPALDAEGYRRLVQPATPERVQAAGLLTDTFSRVNQSCRQCHGDEGHGRGDLIPAIAGQRVEYLRRALQAYRDEHRHSGIMEPLVAPLDDTMVERLARHYASLPARASAKSPPAEIQEQARLIAEQGVPRRRIPACLECHDASGRDHNPAYPSLAGQSARYLENQLHLFHQNRRGGSEFKHLMQPVATRLTPEEIKALAEYFAARR